MTRLEFEMVAILGSWTSEVEGHHRRRKTRVDDHAVASLDGALAVDGRVDGAMSTVTSFPNGYTKGQQKARDGQEVCYHAACSEDLSGPASLPSAKSDLDRKL